MTVTAENFFIRPDYQARSQGVGAQTSNDAIWPADLSPLVATLAHQYECTSIVTIGSHCEQFSTRYPQFQIIDLSIDSALDIAPEVLRNALVINANMIEHQADPVDVLRVIQQCLQHAKVALLSTAAREPDDLGPPTQPNRLRQWTPAELAALLSDAGMPAAYCGLTNLHQPLPQTALAVLPGQSLSAGSVHDLGMFCQHWFQATPQQRAASDAQDSSQLNLMAPSSPLEAGIEYINAAQYEEAFTELVKALQQEPENADVVFQMGRLAAICNMDEDAKELFYQASLRKPELVKAIVDFYRLQVQNARAGKP